GVRNLRDSRFALPVTGAEFRAAVLLCCASWQPFPAASLPDNDTELIGLAGFRGTADEWDRLSGGALYGWYRCSDGRLYHDVIAGLVREAWTKRLAHAYRRECDRIRKENKRRDVLKPPLPALPIPTMSDW